MGQAGLAAVQRVFEAGGRFREGVLHRPGLQAAQGPVSHDLQAALEAGRACANRMVGRFCRNVLGVYPARWTFARVEGVEPTNNRTERTLRPAVLWRKISFGNHREAGCRFAERILTAVQTLRLQNRHVLSFLRDAVAARRAGQPAPALLQTGA